MEFQDALKRRRMVRHFEARQVPSELLQRVLASALQAPSAGHTQGWDFIVLDRPDQTSRFWAMTADPGWRADQDDMAADGFGSMVQAPVIVLPLAHPQAYLDRYARQDKAGSGLPTGPGAQAQWPVPYWLIDTAFATMLILVAAADCGLGALFFRIRQGQDQLLGALGVPAGRQLIGAVAMGFAGKKSPQDGVRPARSFHEVFHAGRW